MTSTLANFSSAIFFLDFIYQKMLLSPFTVSEKNVTDKNLKFYVFKYKE